MKRQDKNLMVWTGMVLVLFLFLISTAAAADKKEALKEQPTISTNAQEVQGTITWISKNKIAIAYQQDQGTEYEILLPFDGNTIKLEHKNKLAELKVGDTVKVQYDEEAIEYPDGKKEGKLKAKVISFISPKAAKSLTSKSTDQSQDGALTIKGLK